MTFRRAVYRLHLTLGFLAGVWLAVIGVSGALMVFGREIDSSLSPELLRVTPETATTTARLDQIVTTVRQHYPGEDVFRIRLPQTASESLEVWLGSTTGNRIYFDPCDGRLLGSRDPQQSLMGWVRRLHVELLLGNFGRNFVGLCGIGSLVLITSGLWMWWPGWRRIPQSLRLRGQAGLRVKLYLWHRTLGVVSAVLLFLSASTGAALVFDRVASNLVSTITRLPMPAETPPTRIRTADVTQWSLDDAVRLAERELPQARATWVWLPTDANRLLAIRMRSQQEWHPNGRSFVYFNTSSNIELHVVDASRANDVTRVTNQFYPLHTGAFGGELTRCLAVISGIVPIVLFVTGLASYLLRRKRSRSAGTAIKDSPGKAPNLSTGEETP